MSSQVGLTKCRLILKKHLRAACYMWVLSGWRRNSVHMPPRALCENLGGTFQGRRHPCPNSPHLPKDGKGCSIVILPGGPVGPHLQSCSSLPFPWLWAAPPTPEQGDLNPVLGASLDPVETSCGVFKVLCFFLTVSWFFPLCTSWSCLLRQVHSLSLFIISDSVR